MKPCAVNKLRLDQVYEASGVLARLLGLLSLGPVAFRCKTDTGRRVHVTACGTASKIDRLMVLARVAAF